MGLEISKCYSYSFHLMSIKCYEDIGYHGGIQAVTFVSNRPMATMVEYRRLLLLGIGQYLKMLWYFEILIWGSMGEPKM